MKIFMIASGNGRGHQARRKALATEFVILGYDVVFVEDKLKERHLQNDDIIISDGVYPYLANKFFRAHVADTIEQEQRVARQVQVVINQSPGADRAVLPWASKRLAGSDYFMFYDEPAPAKYRALNSDYILLVPGSAPDSFFMKCDLRAGMTTWGPSIILGEYREHAALLQDMKNATLCISAASVSALESLALGSPTMVVQTSDDQIIFIRSHPEMIYTPGRLHRFLTSGECARINVPTDGAKKVAMGILETYEQWLS